MIAEYDSLQVRSPWPDELPRLANFFPHEPLHGARLFVLAAPEPERLVGAAAMRIQEDTAELRCRLRPRVLHERRGGFLLDAACAEARERGVRHVVARLAAGAAEDAFLREHGFSETATVERWRIELGTLKARVEKISDVRERRAGWDVRSPRAGDEAQLAKLFGAVPEERLRVRDPEDSNAGGGGFSPEISSVVVVGEELIGALLLRGGGASSHCQIDLCAVAVGHWSAPVAAALIRRSVREALNEGYISMGLRTKDVRCTTEGRPTKNILDRSGAAAVQRMVLLTRSL
jgi:N-acetylglutamate synthase-like GNAT family acetyltransferase